LKGKPTFGLAVTTKLTGRHRCVCARNAPASPDCRGRSWRAVRRSDRLPSWERSSGHCRTTGHTHLRRQIHHGPSQRCGRFDGLAARLRRCPTPGAPARTSSTRRSRAPDLERAKRFVDRGNRNGSRAATPRPGSRSGTFEPVVRVNRCSGGGVLLCTSRFGWYLPDGRTELDKPACTRRYLHAERPGWKARIRQRASRPSHHESGPR
jgi:hypothetical protein